MKKLNKKAQFILIMALSLIMLMVTAYMLFFTINRVQHSLQQAPTEPITTTISRDFERAALNGLRYASQHYYNTSNLKEARVAFSKYITHWAAALLQAYSDAGLELWIGLDKDIVIRDNLLGDIVIPKALTPQEAVEKDSWFKLYCYGRRGISVVALKLKCNVTKEGIYGYEDFYFKMLNATLTNVNKINDTAFSVTVDVFAEENKPVLGLTSENFNVTCMIDENGEWVWRTLTPTNVIDYGNGTYELVITSSQKVYYFSSNETFIVLSVMDNLYVKCELCSVGSIKYIFQSRVPVNGQPNPYEIYYIEILANGSVIWNFQPCPNNTNLIPLPPIPVKHLWVNVSVGDDLNETRSVPYQVERWDNDEPLIPFIETDRIDSTCRLVFPLYFNDTTSRVKKVIIWWKFDADAKPPPQYVKFIPDASGWSIFDNGVYELNLLANESFSQPSFGNDYSIIMKYKDYHAEYFFTGIAHTQWIDINESLKVKLPQYPKELPTGEPFEYMGWKNYSGPIRVVMLRESNYTYDVEDPSHPKYDDRIFHRDILIVPYGTHYALLKIHVKWINAHSMYLTITGDRGSIAGGPYYCMIGMISGSMADYLNSYQYGLNYYAYDGGTPGEYPSTNDLWGFKYYEEKISFSNVGNWFYQYRDEVDGHPSLGFGVVYDKNLLQSAINSFPNTNFQHYYFDYWSWSWKWGDISPSIADEYFYNKFIIRTSPSIGGIDSPFNDFARRVIEVDSVTDFVSFTESLKWWSQATLGYIRYNVPSDIEYSYWVALFVGDGGPKDTGYYSIMQHAPMFYNPPEIIFTSSSN
ncbi:MAG: hypothetical protein ACXQTI_04585 [Candidatus Nezhaarchaeales archaeon]